MPIEAITCPNCGAAGINIDTAREHSFCSYCGTTLRTKDVLHLDTESIALEKLKRNARRSFEVGQYGNARADWERAAKIDRTDHESYWGVVRCAMALRPDCMIGREDADFAKALSYAPPERGAEYMRQAQAHNAGAREIQTARIARAIAAKEAKIAGARLGRLRAWVGGAAAVVFIAALVWRLLMLWAGASYAEMAGFLLTLDALALLGAAGFAVCGVLTKRMKKGG